MFAIGIKTAGGIFMKFHMYLNKQSCSFMNRNQKGCPLLNANKYIYIILMHIYILLEAARPALGASLPSKWSSLISISHKTEFYLSCYQDPGRPQGKNLEF